MKVINTIAAILILAGCRSSVKNNNDTWTEYLGGPDRNHYSTLSQIDTTNVTRLKIAWSYDAPDSGQMEMNPIIVNGTVYGVTAALKAFALDAVTGKELWLYKDTGSVNGVSRGVAYWEDGNDKRIFYTVGVNLIALNARDGKLIPTFGDHGKVNLHLGLPEESKDKSIKSTTPGTVYKNLIIMPVSVSEDADAAPGYIRAFDTRTGKLAWTFHTIPLPGEKGYETWPKEAYKNTNVGSVNNWTGIALDEKTGTVFIPLGSAAPDFYGGNRKGPNLFGNCLLALNANDGTYKWHFQMIHHDLWDRDLSAPPNLITVTKNGKSIDAVAQVTKQGYTYVFDRNTGEPLFPINEVPAPASLLAGEEASPTQPVPSLPKPFARAAYQLTENDISPYAEKKDSLKKILMSADKRLFAPPNTTNVLLLPGYDGGAEYGGAGADPSKGILYVNANEMPWYLTMEKREPHDSNKMHISAGAQIYSTYCSTCHGKDMQGNAASGYPNLASVAQRQTEQYVRQVIYNGKGKMPGFSNVPIEDRQILVDYLFGTEDKDAIFSNKSAVPKDLYRHTGYKKFLDDKGLPAITPPWGTFTAIDLNTGNQIWQITLGITARLPDQDTHPTGCENYGGPIVTENGLLFIAATLDGMFRAFNKYTGKLLWQTKLPAGSYATPAMYSINGKQYIVLACGGEKFDTPRGNKIVAFSLDGTN
ncbi:MAG: PQQ-binding-like beta-propeller repeat protein [Ginsengibacter sp.]